MKWFLAKEGGSAEGPFPAQNIEEWLKTGQITPDTMACPVGGQQWTKLHDIDDFAALLPTPPPPPPPAAPSRSTGSDANIGNVRPNFGILTAAIVCSAACLLIEMFTIGDAGDGPPAVYVLGLLTAAAAITTWAVFHYQLWKFLPDHVSETTPGKAVGFLFIPFFNCYWVFQSYLGVNRGLNKLADASELPQPRVNMGIAIAACVFFVVECAFVLLSFSLPGVDDIPNQYVIRDQVDLTNAYNEVVSQHAGFELLSFLLSSIPGFVLWLLMVLSQKRMVERLLANNASVNLSSGLVQGGT